jgi:hypothetical protein
MAFALATRWTTSDCGERVRGVGYQDAAYELPTVRWLFLGEIRLIRPSTDTRLKRC